MALSKVSVIACCPTTSLKVCGLYLRADTINCSSIIFEEYKYTNSIVKDNDNFWFFKLVCNWSNLSFFVAKPIQFSFNYTILHKALSYLLELIYICHLNTRTNEKHLVALIFHFR